MIDPAIVAKAKAIKLLALDVDGVLTDGKLILGENGNEYKNFHVRDGHGLVMLLESGCQIAVVTARSSKIVSERMAALGIKYVCQEQPNKDKSILDLMDKLQLRPEQTCYVGDDLIDLPAMRHAGLNIAVADAHPKVIERADWVTMKNGGKGAVREVCELIMDAQGQLESLFVQYTTG